MSSRKDNNSMMKRSDFAQKLLDDLRLRKERLATSQKSGHTNPLAVSDRFADSKGGFKGSMEIKAMTTSFKSLNTQNRSILGNRTFTKVEASNQIVPFTRSQSTEKIDLSKVLAFALENAGKATRVDPSGSASIINFLHQIGKRSMDYGRTERRGGPLGMHHPSSSSQVPMIHVHIKEISKGTQKLNQIIKACSTGLGFGNGRSSVEYGKALMQSAVELERSLRMLVDTQEAFSEYKTKSVRKNQIKLLDDDEQEEEDEDEDDGAAKRNEHQMQLELPQFSIGRPFGNFYNIKEFARADMKTRLSSMAYPGDDNINNRQSPTISRASSHRRSVSYSPGEIDLSRFTEEGKQSSSSKPGDRRIPNVIAKLMGLGEYPEEQEDMSYKEHKEKEKESTLKTKIKNGDLRSKDVDLAFQNTRQRIMQANKVAALKNLVALQEEKKLAASRNSTLDLAIHDETRAENVTKNKMRSQKKIWEKVKEGEKDAADHGRSNNGVNGDNKEASYKNESQRMTSKVNKGLRHTIEFQEEKEHDSGAHTMENNNRTSKLHLKSQQKHSNNLGFEHHRLMVDKSESPEAEHRGEALKKKSEKEKLQRGRQKANVSLANHLPKPLSSNDVNKKLALIKNTTAHRKSSNEVNVKSSAGGNRKSKSIDESFRLSPVNGKDLSSKSSKEGSSTTDRVTKGIQVVKEGKFHKSEIPQKVNRAASAKQNGSLSKFTRPMKNQSSIYKQKTDRKQQAALSCNRDTKQMMNNKTKGDPDPLTLMPGEDGSQIIKEVLSQAPPSNRQQIVTTNGNDQEAPKSISDGNEAYRSSQAVTRTSKGTNGEMKSSSPTVEQPQKVHKREFPETLSESDIRLKKILVKSQLFLDTAEALFRLNIPLVALHADGNDYNQEESNLILDCGYEIMKRKGRRQELSIHPFVKVGIRCPRVKSIDDLVKQLRNEFEKLRSYGMEPSIENYLPKILERDVHYNDPDLNSMWDMGWSDSMLAFIEKDDVVRDMERYVLNGLVEEITRDLICI